MNIVNLTPHEILIIRDGEVFRRYAPSGKVARLREWDDATGWLDDVTVVEKYYQSPTLIDLQDFLKKVPNPREEPLPEEQKGVVYIVPMLVGQLLRGKRNDLFGPDFGIGGVRTADGKLSGAEKFIQY